MSFFNSITASENDNNFYHNQCKCVGDLFFKRNYAKQLNSTLASLQNSDNSHQETTAKLANDFHDLFENAQRAKQSKDISGILQGPKYSENIETLNNMHAMLHYPHETPSDQQFYHVKCLHTGDLLIKKRHATQLKTVFTYQNLKISSSKPDVALEIKTATELTTTFNDLCKSVTKTKNSQELNEIYKSPTYTESVEKLRELNATFHNNRKKH